MPSWRRNHHHVYPKTENVDRLEEQLAKSCAAVRTTAWRGQHICLPLALSYSVLDRATNGVLTSSDLPLPEKLNKDINEYTSAFEKPVLKSYQDALWIEW